MKIMDELRKEYADLLKEYDTLIAEKRVDNYERIKSLNMAIARKLEEMLTLLAQSREEIGQTAQYRDQLVEKLKRIQMDYNGLIQTTDKLETLRRIRAQEGDDSRKALFGYLIALGVLVLLVVLVMVIRVWFQRRSASASTASPAMIAPLT